MQIRMPPGPSLLERVDREIARNREMILKDIFRRRREEDERAMLRAEEEQRQRLARLANICKPPPMLPVVPEPVAPVIPCLEQIRERVKPVIPPVVPPEPLPPFLQKRSPFNKNDY
jgi:hypothetical protein